MAEEKRSGNVVDRKITIRDAIYFVALLLAIGMAYQRIIDIGSRQSKYVGQGGLYTEQIAELDSRVDYQEKLLSVEKGEVVP